MPESAETHKRLHRKRLLYLLSGGAIAIVLLVIGAYDLLEFMESPEFCGQLCHVEMYPEWVTYQDSTHSEVTCAECHVGSGASYLVKSKISGVPLIFATLFHTYDTPVETPVHDLRPARDTCEQCHRPERFTGDLIRYYANYAEDEANTPETSSIGFKVGGGQSEVASGIHWHIGAELWYLPLDDERQEIAWVGVTDSNGDIETF
ncbi:MAG: cytochrome C, partial [Chloroflexi bacterium]|nr:cytochrome C [Chloroflexota bacterium]